MKDVLLVFVWHMCTQWVLYNEYILLTFNTILHFRNPDIYTGAKLPRILIKVQKMLIFHETGMVPLVS